MAAKMLRPANSRNSVYGNPVSRFGVTPWPAVFWSIPADTRTYTLTPLGHPVGSIMQTSVLSLKKFSIGVGDRFAHQAKAPLRACQLISQDGVEIVGRNVTENLYERHLRPLFVG
jgi:hypothetical protein